MDFRKFVDLCVENWDHVRFIFQKMSFPEAYIDYIEWVEKNDKKDGFNAWSDWVIEKRKKAELV